MFSKYMNKYLFTLMPGVNDYSPIVTYREKQQPNQSRHAGQFGVYRRWVLNVPHSFSHDDVHHVSLNCKKSFLLRSPCLLFNSITACSHPQPWLPWEGDLALRITAKCLYYQSQSRFKLLSDMFCFPLGWFVTQKRYKCWNRSRRCTSVCTSSLVSLTLT